jgi:hypothetical protein
MANSVAKVQTVNVFGMHLTTTLSRAPHAFAFTSTQQEHTKSAPEMQPRPLPEKGAT